MNAIAATFHSFRTVAGRKQIQLVFEAPVEQTGKILDLLGTPDPGGSKWVGIAPLQLDKVTEQKPEAPAERATARKKESEPWHTLKLSKRAAIMCGEPMFWEWANAQEAKRLGQENCIQIDDAEKAAMWLRWRTNVKSRKEYDTDEAAGRRYLEIERSYRAHRMEVERYGEVSS